MKHLKKSYKAIVNIFLQKILGFSSIMCVFLSLERKNNPIYDMGRSVFQDTHIEGRDYVQVCMKL